MSKIFCGAGQVPKGKHRGTMRECAQRNQIRYWGVKKIDPRILEDSIKLNKYGGRDKVQAKLVGLRAKLKKIKSNHDVEKKESRKKKMKKEYEKTYKEYKKIQAVFKVLDKIRDREIAAEESRKKRLKKKKSKSSKKSKKSKK